MKKLFTAMLIMAAVGTAEAQIIDSYSESNQDSITPFGDDASNVPSGVAGGYGVCFTGNGQTITDTKWYLQKILSPTGNAVAKIWTMTGTFGTNGNVGTLLATSDNVDVTTIGGSLALVTFPFSGVNQYVTTNGTRYVSTVEYQRGGGSGDYLNLGYDSTGTHAGTWVYHNQGTSGVWTSADSGLDLCFYVDGTSAGATTIPNSKWFFLP